MRRSKFLIVVYARQAAAEGWRAADELGEPSRGIGMSGSTIQQVSSVRLIARLAALWIVLLVLPFAERTLLAAKTYYFLYIGLGLVFVLYGLTIRSLFSFLYRQDETRLTFGLRIWRGPFLFAAFCQSSLSNTIFFPTRQSYIADL